MAFRAEGDIRSRDFGSIRGTLQKAAVKCWFTAGGKAMPLMMKLQSDRQEILTVDHIIVLRTEKKWYAGILTWEYTCQALVEGKMVPFVLLFHPEECQWKLKRTKEK